ncbi:MAG: transcriptional repressor [Thermanaeromonas sp.]|uniref:Fur family transcriptional regulator n=1 Tax=Thermanaeromonas sp. TaxID=2003697 RepID=UPI00243ACDFF|nr:transcriptional repressor [Thermanaeromonas sp.]MCG0278180.1 transcriptional repressor [Thermanaeromonas sp.]
MVEHLKQRFRERGYRLTRQREAIIEVLAGTGEHLTAEEVHQRVQSICPELNLATVYRNLNLLAEQKIIGKVDFGDGPARFEARSEHHHHLYCLRCGRVVDLLHCPVHLDEKISETYRFRVTGHQFEAYGYCMGCELLNGKVGKP